MKTSNRISRGRFAIALALVTSVSISITACRSQDDVDLDEDASAGEGAGLDGNEGEEPGGDGPGSNGVFEEPNGSNSPDEICESSSAEAELKPLTLALVLDRSGSMAGNRWASATSALGAFFLDPDAAGLEVGLNLFPPPGSNSCNAADHNPMQVAPAALPAGAGALQDQFQDHPPNGGGTPLGVAAVGSLDFLIQYQSDNPEHVVAAVLATDGAPNGCAPSNIAAIGDHLATVYKDHGIPTYVIGIEGANVVSLDSLADKGGTTAAIDVTQNTAGLTQAMLDIRQSLLGCEFPIPDDPSGQPFDKTRLNVEYTSTQDLPTTTPLDKAAGLAGCGPSGGWYYDNEDDPTTVLLCPATCDAVQADPTAQISLEFGCPTIVQ